MRSQTEADKGLALAEICKARAVKPASLARAMDTSPQTVNNWLKRGVSTEYALRVSNFLGCHPTEISNIQPIARASLVAEDTTNAPENAQHSRKAYKLPLADTPLQKFMAREKLRVLTLAEIADPACPRNIQHRIPQGCSEFCDLIPFESSENAYCYQIADQSTSPDYRLHEIVLIDPEVSAINGDDAMVITPDGNAHLKRLHITKEGLYLETINPQWPNRISKAPEGTRVDGVVTGSWLARISRELS